MWLGGGRSEALSDIADDARIEQLAQYERYIVQNSFAYSPVSTHAAPMVMRCCEA
jgi:hypothetical protein